MINLLPPEKKKQIRAGQINILLLRYCMASLMLLLLLLAVSGGAYVIMENSKRSAESTIQESVAKSAKYQQIQKDADTFRNNLTTAKNILDKEVHYSDIAIKIAQTIPGGVTLDSLQLDAKTFDQPITLNATGRSYDDSIRLKTAFEQSPIFKDVHLLSVSYGGDGTNPDTNFWMISISVTIISEEIKS